jgi:hypothetical protein
MRFPYGGHGAAPGVRIDTNSSPAKGEYCSRARFPFDRESGSGIRCFVPNSSLHSPLSAPSKDVQGSVSCTDLLGVGFAESRGLFFQAWKMNLSHRRWSPEPRVRTPPIASLNAVRSQVADDRATLFSLCFPLWPWSSFGGEVAETIVRQRALRRTANAPRALAKLTKLNNR